MHSVRRFQGFLEIALGPRWEKALCLSQGHSDVLPHRESNQGITILRLLARCFTTESRRRLPNTKMNIV